ncbi:MAG: DUF1592 domain-containing protein [Myxococcaceae bacterium]|nr:DUF1592 domain-containing protein [Myxococcaceae bacterium]
MRQNHLRAEAGRTALAILAGVGLVLSGCTGRIGDDGSAGSEFPTEPPPGVDPYSPEVEPPPFHPAPLRMRRLLGWQYQNAIHDLLGAAAASAITVPADAAVNGFDAIGASQLAISPQAVEQFEAASYAAVEAGLADPVRHQALVPCTPSAPDDAGCLATVVRTFGHRAWRRPLTDEEVQTYVSVGQMAGAAYGVFDKGVEFALAGLLQSPNFLYLPEVGEPDPENPSRLRLTSLEMGARLAFFLTGTLPDDELLAAAESGALTSADAVRAQALRLVDKPEARDALNRFFDEAFRLRELDKVAKDPETFPEFTPALAKSMQQETRLLIDDVVWDRDADFRDVFDATYTFVDLALAQLYGIDGAPGSGFGRVELDPNGLRGGFLGHAAFLSLMAHPRTTSPTHRGKFILERLLCANVPAPPPNVNTSLEDASTETMTMRERLTAHVANPSCASCHKMVDSIGFGFENFDAIGQLQFTDKGKPVDASATFGDHGSFTGALQLGRMLRDDPRVPSCLVRNLFRMASGHVDTYGEVAPLKAAEQSFIANGYRLKSLLVELAASDAFRFASAQEVQP